MAGQIKGTADTNVSAVMGGILDDIQSLFRQEISLVRGEIKQTMYRIKTSALSYGGSFAALFLGALMLCFMGAHLLHDWGTAVELLHDGLPLWSCFGILGGALLVVGTILYILARITSSRLGSISD